MSVRVNLLPEATKAKDRAAQQRGIALLCALLLLVLLGGVWFWGDRQISNAEQELADEEARTAELRQEQAELVAFQELADRREQSEQLLTAAMGDEVSLAGLLQDVAAVMPNDAQLETLVFTLEAELPEDPDAIPASVGTFNLSGRTLTSHAPGVERVLLSLDKIAALDELFLNTSALDEPDERFATFSLDGRVGPEAATGRYDEGLPEELR